MDPDNYCEKKMSSEKSATYQAWADSDGILFTTLEGVAWHRERGLLSAEATLLHEVIADTPEEASAVHHIKMGWAPYKPMGEAAPCPHCGAYFYPESSGICPNCGPIC